ncbi:MAG TPA: aminopeptidase P family protein, partial [Planctomycetaceae bacterium]|nr:aminopeptidase P family protein [Planctomycetaceae bacterium]
EVQKAAIAAAGRPGLVYGDFRACTPTSPKQGGLPTDYKLQAGDLFVLDYSVVLCGYRSDFTNTFAVTEPTEGQKELFAICQAGMKAGEETLKAGVSCAEVYKNVKQPYL